MLAEVVSVQGPKSSRNLSRICSPGWRFLLAWVWGMVGYCAPALGAPRAGHDSTGLLVGANGFPQASLVLAAVLLLVLLVVRELGFRHRLDQARQDSQKVMEEALRKSELKYQELFNGTSDAIFIHEIGTMNVIDVNDRAVAMLGYSREEFCQLPVDAMSLGSPPYFGDNAIARSRLVETEGPQVFPWRARKKDGQLLWVEVALRQVELEGQPRILALARDVDERIRSQEALNQSEAMYRALFHQAGNAYMFIETDNTMSLVNMEMEKMLGLSREEIEGQYKWTDFIAEPEDLKRMQEYHELRRSQPGTAPNTYETRIKDRRGRVFEALVTAVILPGTSQTLASVTDISQLRSAERARESSEIMYQAIFENTGTASVIVAADTTIQLANSEWLNLSGYSREETEGRQSWTSHVHPEDLDRMKGYHYERRQDGQASRKYQFRFIRRNGEIRYIANTVTLIPGTELSISSLVDITDLRNAEEERSRLQSLLASIIDSMPSVLVGVDQERRITQWNVQAERYTSLSQKEVAGRNVFEVLPLLTAHADLIERTLAGGGISSIEKMMLFDEGKTSYADVTVYSLEDSENKGGVIRIDDITDKVRLENIMIQTEKMMSVGGLAAGMAHEINNPLGGIIQGAQNISRRLDPSLEQNTIAAREYGIDMETLTGYLQERKIFDMLEGIRRSGVRAARIVSNMLQFSRTGESEHQLCDPVRLLDGALELASNDYDLKKKYDFRQITIERHYDQRLGVINCAETEIEQVLLNLLKNAAYAMMSCEPPLSHPIITLRAYPEADKAVIEVEDNGPGMNENIAKRIFEPFFTTKAPGSGTGLGLSVSYFIVTENHRGQIYVETQPGRGARFVIKLPMKGKVNAENVPSR